MLCGGQGFGVDEECLFTVGKDSVIDLGEPTVFDKGNIDQYKF
nr:hypothetical protein [Streptomyces polyasparticus]